MNINRLIQDDDAVSPVIGIILVIALTVILAAIISTFALGLGQQVQDTGPQASFTFEFNPDGGEYEVVAIHKGGDTIDASAATLELVGDGKQLANTSDAQFETQDTLDSSTEGKTVPGGTEVRVIWTSANGESSATLAKDTAPN